MEVDNLEEHKSSHGGLRAGAGRPKGAVNKIPRKVKEDIIEVFELLGGTQTMLEWAQADQKNQTEFYKMYGRLAPMDVKLSGDAENPIEMRFGWMK
jgi:hypothetical protein